VAADLFKSEQGPTSQQQQQVQPEESGPEDK
jgi:hypothetical protein